MSDQSELQEALDELDRSAQAIRDAVYSALKFEEICTSMEAALEKIGEYFKAIIKF